MVEGVSGKLKRVASKRKSGPAMAVIEKLETQASLTEQAHRSIKRYILAGDLLSEERLTEDFFSRQLGISKSPVREAMNSLQNEGLLRIEPRRGAYVPRYSGREIQDLYDLREALEVFATATAVLTPALLAALRASVRRTKKLLAADDKAAHIEEDIAFHSRIVNATGNAELSRVHRNIQDKLWLCRCQTYQLTSPDTPSAHQAITKALAEGDREAAVEATRRHIRFVCKALVSAAAK